MALKKLVAGNWKMHGLSADLAEIEAIADASRAISARRRRAVRAGDPDRARGARGSRLRDRRPGCPPRRKGRAYRLHLGADAARRRRRPDHRRPQRAARCAARERRRGQGQGGGGAGCRARRHPLRRREPRRARGGRRRRDRRRAARRLRFRDARAEAASLAIAYEPIWAIGTGKVPTVAEIGEMHARDPRPAGRRLRR